MTVPPDVLTVIRDRISAGLYRTGQHVIEHGASEGFTARDARAAVMTGIIIEHYTDRPRCLSTLSAVI